MTGRPDSTEAAPYYFTYIDRVEGDDPLAVLERQLDESHELLAAIPDTRSLHRYAPDKWTIRQVLNHVTDTERSFAFRALWFARGFESPLPSYDQDVAAAAAEANRVHWAQHVEEFRAVRLGTILLYRHLPPEAWLRRGTASGNPFSVRALAFIAAGHFAHHVRIIEERYL